MFQEIIEGHRSIVSARSPYLRDEITRAIERQARGEQSVRTFILVLRFLIF